MRRRLPAGVRMYTGDDFNYAELIAGDERPFRRAARHLRRHCSGRVGGARRRWRGAGKNGFFDILEPTVPLSRQIFKAPTRFYKTGVVFLAYLNGLQDHFVMVGGQESARSLLHLAELFRLADKAGVLRDPELAAERMSGFWRSWHPMTPVEGLSINLATVRRQWDMAGGRGVPAARHHRDLSLARPGGGDGAGAAAQLSGQRAPCDRALPGRVLSGADAAGGRGDRRHRRAVDEAAALGADCLVLVVGGLPAVKTSPRRGRWCWTGWRDAAVCPGGGRAARHRAAAPSMPPTGPA